MEIPNKVKKVWEAEIKNYGHENICTEAGVNYRTLKRAVEMGNCKPYIFDLINASIKKLRSKRDKSIKKLIA